MNLGHGVEGRAEAAVDAEYLVCDDGGDGEAVEGVDEGFPCFDARAALALVVEAIHAGDVCAFVVSA
ncbi:hypothetical protein NEOLI_004126 [Neolecta irregularis DAH-3]|uniref:Uncharacterized protein n=1 Tax=Neolecta irregularis (strain DAH-3) TaxID=1198029 RepID=A0A1U7LT18_NEOID|nr:hypothetical protein NEOLI_004126 [Neolecta irregularis DAH-3]|eukprot:OLL25794.1 hypothetical protein NEOLI_004126 [Neolecta irregularis DAH-3]